MKPLPDREGPSPLSSADSIESAALAWLFEREEGFSRSRALEYRQWRQADARHAAAIERLEQTLGLLAELPQHRAELNAEFNRGASVVPFPKEADTEVPAVRGNRRRVRAWVRGGIAAAVAIGLGVSLGWRALQPSHEIRFATTAAGYERARLDDGSTLELNAASAVRVQFTRKERLAALEGGEAHFSVAHDEARPFIVRAGGVSVRAVGTAFNVRCASDGAVEVTVVEGKVRVWRNKSGDTAAASDAAGPATEAGSGAREGVGGTEPLVKAGERIVLLDKVAKPIVEPVTQAALRQALAWQGRLVDFADAPLAGVVARFNARNRLQLVLVDAELGAHPIGGTFALDEVEAFVRLLERDGEIVAERRGETEILLRRSR